MEKRAGDADDEVVPTPGDSHRVVEKSSQKKKPNYTTSFDRSTNNGSSNLKVRPPTATKRPVVHHNPYESFPNANTVVINPSEGENSSSMLSRVDGGVYGFGSDTQWCMPLTTLLDISRISSRTPSLFHLI